MKRTLVAAACGVLLTAGPAVASTTEPTNANCFVAGNHLCGGATLHGKHIILARGRPYRIRVYWPYPSNWVTTFRVRCARPRGGTVLYARDGNTDHAWIRTCRHTYKVAIS